jgi:hypothetical protein
MEAKLVVVGGEAKPKEIPIQPPLVIGRGREVTLTLPHPLVSRNHCEIDESDGYLVVRDLGSLNGTFINNERVAEAVLPPGDLLTIGTVTFRAVYEVPSDKRQLEFVEASANTDVGELGVDDFDLIEFDDDEGTAIAEVEIDEDEMGHPDDVTEHAPSDAAEQEVEGDGLAQFLQKME